MALVRGAAGAQAAPVVADSVPCGHAGCSYEGTQANVNRHKAAAHRE